MTDVHRLPRDVNIDDLGQLPSTICWRFVAWKEGECTICRKKGSFIDRGLAVHVSQLTLCDCECSSLIYDDRVLQSDLWDHSSGSFIDVSQLLPHSATHCELSLTQQLPPLASKQCFLRCAHNHVHACVGWFIDDTHWNAHWSGVW